MEMEMEMRATPFGGNVPPEGDHGEIPLNPLSFSDIPFRFVLYVWCMGNLCSYMFHDLVVYQYSRRLPSSNSSKLPPRRHFDTLPALGYENAP